MGRPRKSAQGKKKNTVTSAVSKVKKKQSAAKTRPHAYKTRSTKDSPGSNDLETSPFKGFSESVTKGKVKELRLYESFDDEKKLSPVKSVEGDKNDAFDKLLNDEDYKCHFPKNMKTYTNRKKHLHESPLLEFQDCRNRNDVVKWLNDTRNVFEQLTQSQSEVPVDGCSQMTLDEPSVSQQKPPKTKHLNRESKKVRRSPYKLRAKSLDIQIKKNSQGGRSKRHSFSGDTLDAENYNIEEVVTPIPAEENAKIIIDLMEDEYLNNIERELQHDKKNQSGWDRIKDMSKSMSVKKPKQLNIVKRGSPPDNSKKGSSVDHNKNLTYDYDVLENYFIENMEKLLDNNDKSCSSNSMLSSVLDCGKSFIRSIKNLAETDRDSLHGLKPLVFDLQQIFDLCKKDTLTASTQTSVDTVTASTQTSAVPSFNKYVQTESSSVDFGVQIDPNLSDACAQTTERLQTHEFVQTENDKNDVEVQTEDVGVEQESSQRTPSRTNSTLSDIFFLNENEKREITEALDENFSNEQDNPQVADEDKPKTDAFSDDFDFNFNTEDIMKDISSTGREEDKNVEVVQTAQTVESVILVSTESNNVNKGTKRQFPGSPVCDPERYRSKRPCAQFIEDLSVDFSSQEEERGRVEGTEKFSEDSDDYDQCLANALKQYEDSVDSKIQPETTPKTRTQEQIEELERMIYNATTSKPVTNQNNHSPIKQKRVAEKNSCHVVEDNTDYFNTSSCISGINKISRKSLFEPKNDRAKSQANAFSESLFDSDRNNTVVANCTLTEDNVDVVMKGIDRMDEMMSADEEVEEIFENSTSKVIILENIVLQSGDNNVTGVDCLSQSSETSDLDVVECTPQRTVSSIARHREESALDVTLPPPLEFQDSEKPNPNKSSSTNDDDDVSLISPPRRPLAVVNKVTSTPFSQKQDSEALSLSPISCVGSSRKSSKFCNESNTENQNPAAKSPIKRNNAKRNDPQQENKRLSIYEMAQHQFSKFSPLTIVKKAPQSRSSHGHSLSQRQNSILNYVRPSQESPKSQKSDSFDATWKRRPCIACSRVSRDEVMAISSMTTKKLGTYSGTFSPKVTHLIVSVNEKNCLKDHTIKFISAVASGIWVLNFRWIQECLAKNALVPEEPYEVLDVSGVPGPQRARLMRATKPLLKGYKIHVAAPFVSTTQSEVENLVRVLGGKVVPSPEHLLDRNGYICVVVTEARATQDFELYETWLEALKVVTVDMEWLSRSVGQYQLLSLRPFTLCSDDSIDHLGYPPELTANMAYSLSQQTFSSVP